MIRQSDICNYVSLIKSLKDEDYNQKIICTQLPTKNFFTRKNSLKSRSYARKLCNLKNKGSQFSNSIQLTSQSTKDLRKQQSQHLLNKRRKIFEMYDQQSKKSQSQIYVHAYPNAYMNTIFLTNKASCPSFYDNSLRYNKLTHKRARANTGQMSSSTKLFSFKVGEVKNIQDLSIKSIGDKKNMRNTMRNIRQSQFQTKKRYQSMKNSSNSSPQQFKLNRSPLKNIEKLKQLTIRLKEQNLKLTGSSSHHPLEVFRDVYVIDGWQYPVDSQSSISSSRYK